ncbi:hypothetical protein [Mesobacillus jeotgali]|uniref:hypothetical protein n=1 Tax=Mesobacillus jeotgali TaxID=129985 RepID=UPI001115AF22|nr:hypothetical protein [Mesobacillus jeotgali]
MISISAVLLTAIIFLTVNKTKKKYLLKENIPSNLGLIKGVPADKILVKLEDSISYEYTNQVKKRYLSDHPDITEDEYEWRLFELKRYFLLNSVMKSVPMFSPKVDAVWHEMLMFTKQYETFSESYMGGMLHHTPNLESDPEPQQRAFFDWIFSQLFEITQYTWQVWGDFFHYPLDAGLLRTISSLSDEQLKLRYFRVSSENEFLVDYLITQLRSQLEKAQDLYLTNKKGKFERPAIYGDLSGLSMMMVFYSYFYFDEYWNYAKEYAYMNN